MAASGKPRFVEIGANLLDGMFRGRYHGKRAHGSDLTTVLDRAAAAGMSHLMITASNLKQARLAHAMCLRHNAATGEGGLRLFCTVGVHPTNTTQLEFTPKKTGGAESTATPAAVGGAAAEPCCSTAKHSDDETDLEEQLHEAISRPSTGGAVAGHAPADAGAASAAAGAAGRAAHTALHSQPKSKEEYVAALDELIAEGKRAGTVVAIGA
jgi:Tat protein secretion system quality control protein TatD with DNase activity